MKKVISILLCSILLFASCSSMKNSGKGAIIGTGAGGALGAGIGALIGGEKGAMIGAAVGVAVGAGTGAIIGNAMDKKAAELAELENAKVETITLANGLTGIKVTFDSGILFETNKYALSNESKETLKNFATQMGDFADTDITIYGHTDNTGSDAVNEKLSLNRANAVSKYLQSNGIEKKRITAEGKSYSMPVADNETAEGRAQNRRVEVYITADEDMIAAAKAQAGE